ncbi:hypothetical protein E2C01_079988 [Portunus trituberculatus]|uniref:Uncharacterized protein n=1 Tax=Portunus trituberculatus TaxID=210409 RepID=A0A5B7IYC4_PORTR|nr:hypothetical protein [Portunus trituberculatus]
MLRLSDELICMPIAVDSSVQAMRRSEPWGHAATCSTTPQENHHRY